MKIPKVVHAVPDRVLKAENHALPIRPNCKVILLGLSCCWRGHGEGSICLLIDASDAKMLRDARVAASTGRTAAFWWSGEGPQRAGSSPR
jgi:hypothetical protein